MNDEFLIRKCVNGEASAFNTLVWRWEKPIYNFILRYMGDMDLSKDILQRTFIRAYGSLAKLKDPARFSSWLYQIALNQCKDELKKKKRHYVPIDDVRRDEDDPRPKTAVLKSDPAEHPARMAETEGIAAVLQRALQTIPEEQRVVIIMKQYHGLKFSEIAEVLSEPLNTIKSRMYYGLAALRRTLEGWGLDREELRYEV